MNLTFRQHKDDLDMVEILGTRKSYGGNKLLIWGAVNIDMLTGEILQALEASGEVDVLVSLHESEIEK